jgi:hypothetical protein
MRGLSRQFIAALLIVSAALITSAAIVQAAPEAGTARPSGYVPRSLDECRGDNETNDFRCYATYYAAKTYYEDKEAVFADLKQSYESDAYVKAECHQLTHIIGRTGYKRYGGLDKSYEHGDAICWSGYYHGAIEQAITDIGPERITADAPTVCKSFADKRMYSFDHFNCVHGLGHGLMAVGAYNLPDSLKLCDVMTSSWERESCYGGVFMENVMVATRGNGTTAYFKDSEPLYPCTFVERPYKEQCYLMQTSQVLQKNGYDFAKTFQECGKADEGFVDTCYRSLGRDASGSTVSDIKRTVEICRLAPNRDGLHNCMLGAVRDFVSYYHSDQQALQLCASFGGETEAPCQQDVKLYYKAF